MRGWMFIFLVLVLAACGDKSEDKKDVPPTMPSLATQSPVLVHLQRDYESLRESHQAISDVFEALNALEQVQCGTYPEMLGPESISAENDPVYESLAETLDQAAIAIEEAVTVWQMECERPGGRVDAATIRSGVLITRAAGDRLDEAETMLTAIQN
jgi:hypothetical protein